MMLRGSESEVLILAPFPFTFYSPSTTSILYILPVTALQICSAAAIERSTFNRPTVLETVSINILC